MSRRLRECTFLIPIRRDSDLSDGDLQGTQAWEWLREQLWELFDTAGTIAPGLYEGGYQDSDTQQRVYDQSRKYILAVSKRDLSKLRDLLRDACGVFQQKCIYLSVAGEVEFIEHPVL